MTRYIPIARSRSFPLTRTPQNLPLKKPVFADEEDFTGMAGGLGRQEIFP
jgi:hypothetical protein